MPGRRRAQLSDDVANYVRNLVMAGELPPGASVRPEAIATTMGVSTTPAREGLQALRVEGFLELLPRRGFIVAPLTGADIRDLFRANSLIAGELAARATARAESADLSELRRLHGILLAAAEAGDLPHLEEANHAFHRAINHIAASRKIAWVLSLVGRYVPRLFYSTIEGWPAATVQDHSTILNCIVSGDAEGARAAMQSHIVHAGELLATQFDKRTRNDVPREIG